MSNIHPTAIVDPSAKIDPSTVVGPFTIIGEDVQIGKNNRIGPHCVIENTTMGDNNELIASCFIGVKPQDLSYKGEHTRVVMGNGNKIRECVTVHRSTFVDKPTTVGNNCLLMANSHVAHDVQMGNNVIVANCSAIAGHVIVEDRAIISGLVGIHQFSRIGTMAMVSGGSAVILDIPPYCNAQGDRAKTAGINIIGMRRAGLDHSVISAVRRAYKTIFRSGKRIEEACAELEKENPCAEVKHLIEFCRTSSRGLTPARHKASGKDDE